ncbi:MAG: hypothetical protein OXJ90_27460 [Spirochaetaceae bacterium]|nr:hypothetical protein [Spirochaetaceae bacterium]
MSAVDIDGLARVAQAVDLPIAIGVGQKHVQQHVGVYCGNHRPRISSM